MLNGGELCTLRSLLYVLNNCGGNHFGNTCIVRIYYVGAVVILNAYYTCAEKRILCVYCTYNMGILAHV